jgi:hypothetical protein
MCNSDFEGMMPARYLRHGAQPEEAPEIKEMPQLQPFWAAGFSFSRGHFKLRVPYDAYQPMVFQGEEIAIGIRGFTYGYDFYAPRDSVVFHEYAVKSKRRHKVHMFWYVSWLLFLVSSLTSACSSSDTQGKHEVRGYRSEIVETCDLYHWYGA